MVLLGFADPRLDCGVRETGAVVEAAVDNLIEACCRSGVGASEPVVNSVLLTASGVCAWSQRVLTAAENEYAAKLKNPGIRISYLMAHALLRSLLSRLTGYPSRDLVMAPGLRGKPELKADDNTHFNLSRRNGVVAIAIGGRSIGVDVEVVRPVLGLEQIARSMFSDRERAFVFDSKREGELARFLDLWTRKEALIKASGAGIRAMPMVEALEARSDAPAADGTWAPYVILSVKTDLRYRCALAIRA